MKNFTKKLALLFGMVFMTSYSFAQDQTWIDLDGSNDYLDFGTDNILAGKTQFTVEMKIHFDNSAGDYTILGQRTSDANRTIVLQRWNGAIYLFISNTNYGYCSFIPCSGSLYHFAIVYDGSGISNSDRMKFYIDGVLQTLTFVGTVDAISHTTSPAANLVLGCEHNGAATQLQYLDGQYGEFCIWNYAMSQADVAGRIGPEVLGTEPGLVEYFHFDNGIPGGTNTSIAFFAGGKGVSTIIPRNMTLTGSSSNFTFTPVLFNSVDTTYFVFDPTITSNASGATFQWLDCNSGFAPIPGATSQSFTASANGSYAVKVTQGACTDTTACIAIFNVGLPELKAGSVSIYPNPVSNELLLENKSIQELVRYEIMNATGQVIISGTITERAAVNIARLSPAVYVIRIWTERGFLVQKIVKSEPY